MKRFSASSAKDLKLPQLKVIVKFDGGSGV
jgi:hypothetical protein